MHNTIKLLFNATQQRREEEGELRLMSADRKHIRTQSQPEANPSVHRKRTSGGEKEAESVRKSRPLKEEGDLKDEEHKQKVSGGGRFGGEKNIMSMSCAN